MSIVVLSHSHCSLHRCTTNMTVPGMHGMLSGMKNYLPWVAAAVVAVAVYFAVRPRHTPPAAILPADLVRGYVAGRVTDGTPVRVVIPYPLRPTADPLVWEFVPSLGSYPPTVRFHFASPPAPARVVSGVVAGIVDDGRPRVSGVQGVLVVRDAAGD